MLIQSEYQKLMGKVASQKKSFAVILIVGAAILLGIVIFYTGFHIGFYAGIKEATIGILND